MASFNTSGIRFFLNGLTALSAFTRVSVSGDGTLFAAGVTGPCVGVLDLDVAASGDAAVRLPNMNGSRKMIASTAISAWAYVYSAASGQVGPTAASAVTVGIAAGGSPIAGTGNAASATGSVIEVLPVEGLTLQ